MPPCAWLRALPPLAFLAAAVLGLGQAAAPPTVDQWQERRTGGKPGEYSLVYFGEQAPAAWPFVLYKTRLTPTRSIPRPVIRTDCLNSLVSG